MRSRQMLMAAILGMAIAGGAFGQDWPQWRGAGRDAKVGDFKAPASWPKELAAKWTEKVGMGGDSSVSLVGDNLYVFLREGDEEVIACLKAADGADVWRNRYKTAGVTGADKGHAGPRATPAVGEGMVVTLGVNGVVSCMNAKDGTLAWRKESETEGYDVPRFHTASSPLIVDGMAIVQLGGAKGGAVVAYKLTDGSEKWKAKGDGAGYASPAVVSVDGVKLVVALTEKRVVALKLADGTEVWQTAFAPAGMTYNSVSPVVDGATVIYTGSGRGMKAVKFSKEGEKFGVKEVWTNPDVAAAFCTPVLHEGKLFGLSAGAGRRSGGGKFFCVDAGSGKTLWMDEKTRGTDYGAMVDAGSAIVALTGVGELIFIEPSDKGYKELASVKVSEKPTYGYPILSGNRIFVRDEDSLKMFVVE